MYRPSTNTVFGSQLPTSRGRKSPRSSSRILLPEPARACARVPPPAPVPMMITSLCSATATSFYPCHAASGARRQHHPQGGSLLPAARSDQLKLAGPADRLAPVCRRQLVADVLDMRFDSVAGDIQLTGDLGGGQQARDVSQHFPFALGERLDH